MPTLIPARGEPREITPHDGRAFTLAELQGLVGGHIEALYAPDGWVAFLNEDGKRLHLPRNAAATERLRAALQPTDYIVGDVVLCARTAAPHVPRRIWQR